MDLDDLVGELEAELIRHNPDFRGVGSSSSTYEACAWR